MAEQTERLTVPAAAELMKTTSLNVMMHIKRGLIAGEEVEGTWYVGADSLTNYINKTGDAAGNSVCKSSCSHSCPSCG